MIGESNHLGRDGIHYDLFIKVGRLSVTLSPAAGSHQPCNLQMECQYHTRLARHHLLSTAESPRELRRLLFFYFKHV